MNINALIITDRVEGSTRMKFQASQSSKSSPHFFLHLVADDFRQLKKELRTVLPARKAL